LKIGFSNSRPGLFWVGWVSLVGCLFLIVNGKVWAAQSIDSSFETEVVSSFIQLTQADEEETNEASKQETKEITKENEGWLPPEPRPEKYDWIQLKSGEWLKGKLEVLYDRKLEFDSDELDYLEFDIEDIKQIRGHSIFSVRFAGPVTVIGYLQVTETKVYVTWGEDKQEFDRDQLIAIAYGEPKEKNYWSAKLSLGANFTSGNSDQTEYSAIGKVMRRTSGSRFVLDYLGNFTRTENIETVKSQTKRFF